MPMVLLACGFESHRAHQFDILFKGVYMKRSTAAFLIVLSVVLICIDLCKPPRVVEVCKGYDDLYPMYTNVTSLDYERDIVTVSDAAGNLWEFVGCDDWRIGDSCVCIMDSLGTDVITDDVVLDARYCG